MSLDIAERTLGTLLKGGPGSGWYAPPKGTHSGEKHRASGSGRSKGSSTAESGWTESAFGRKTKYWKATGEQRLPSEVLDAKSGVLLVSKDGKEIIASPADVRHADLVYGLGIRGAEFDTWKRFRMRDGYLYAATGTVGDVGIGKTDMEYDVAAERLIARSIPALMRAGFAPDTRFRWYTSASHVIDLTLGSFVAAKDMLEALLKGGPNSGWYAPPKGTHTAHRHNVVGSGKSKADKPQTLSDYMYDVRRKAEGSSKSYRDVEAAVKAAKPGYSGTDVEMMIDVMSLDKERFMHYAEKIGMKDAEKLADAYFKEQGEISRQVAYQEWKVKEALAAPVQGHRQYVYDTVGAPDSIYDMAKQPVDDSRGHLIRDYGITVSDNVGLPPEFAKQYTDWVYNMAEGDPRIKLAVQGVDRLVFQRTPSHSTASMQVTGRTISVNFKPDRPFEEAYHNPGMMLHELGHVFDSVYSKSGADAVKAGFGRGKAPSTYAVGNPLEEFAEMYAAVIGGNQSVKAWVPDKYAYIERMIDAGVEQQ